LRLKRGNGLHVPGPERRQDLRSIERAEELANGGAIGRRILARGEPIARR